LNRGMSRKTTSRAIRALLATVERPDRRRTHLKGRALGIL
jgi:hypothetical protein